MCVCVCVYISDSFTVHLKLTQHFTSYLNFKKFLKKSKRDI